ncbi:oligosaccharide flippase family protein [Colwellia piezophila]|uniref:oligosaccharide flippase family protein n=1 Tax=Colwellia piezophila TaxID=211668 RepID=UPI0003779EF1|nr:oligosaccharide flippase family protein [Colwellia piezophila]
MKSNRLLENSAALVFLQFLNYLSPFIILPYLTRSLGLEGFGILSFSLAFCMLLFIVTDYGFGVSSPEYIAKNKLNYQKISSYISGVIFIKFLFIIAIGAFGCVFFLLVDFRFFEEKGITASLILSMYALIITQGFQINWFFQGIEKFKLIVLYSVLSKIIYVLLVLLFVHSIADLAYVFISLAIGNCISLIFSYKQINREKYKFKKVSFLYIKKLILDNFGYFLSRLSVSSYSTFNSIILGSISNINNVALYSSAEKIYQACQNLTYAVSQAFFPYLSRTNNVKVLHQYVLATFILLLPIVSVIIIYDFTSYIVVWFFGPVFESSSNILDVFLICALVNFLSVNYGYPLFASINKTKLVNYTVYLASTIQVLMLITLYYLEGITPINLVYCVLISELVVLFSRLSLYFRFK